MSRELKFRVYIKRLDKIFPSAGIERPIDSGRTWGFGELDGKIEHFDTTHGDVVMQFIGIKDKNGKDVYEEDIYTFDTPRKKNPRLYIVSSIQDFFKEKGLSEGEYGYSYDKLRVVGNRFENPELIP